MSTDAIDRLFDLPLDAFVSARNQLAAELKRGGDRDGSEAVKKLPKPAAGAWAINQIARKHNEALERFLRATDRLFRAQVRGISSDAVDPDFHAAAQEQRSALGAMLEHAEALLKDGGHGTTRAMIERVGATLRAAVLDEAARKLLEAGQMTEEKGDSGFEALAAQLEAAPAVSARPKASPERPAARPASRAPLKGAEPRAKAAETQKGVDANKASIAAARQRVQELRREEAELKDGIRAQERKMIEARNAHDQAKQTLLRARRVLEQAEREVGLEETRVARLNKEKEQGEAAVEAARAALRDVAARHREADDALRRARKTL